MSIEEIIAQIMANHDQSLTTSSTPKQYSCAECCDTGWVRFMQDGYSYSRECDCVKARKAKGLMIKSGLGDALEQQTFDSFVVENDMQKQIKDTARHYLDALFSMPSDAQRKPWLYISGNPGCGKTHICTAVCGELLRGGMEVVYMQWLAEARRLKSYINEPDFDRLVERYTDCAVLYVDDLFKQTWTGKPILTEADVKMAFAILNDRYLRNMPTIISSEWSLGSLMEADEGVFSRVYERCKEHTVHVPRDAKYNYRITRWKGTA